MKFEQIKLNETGWRGKGACVGKHGRTMGIWNMADKEKGEREENEGLGKEKRRGHRTKREMKRSQEEKHRKQQHNE